MGVFMPVAISNIILQDYCLHPVVLSGLGYVPMPTFIAPIIGITICLKIDCLRLYICCCLKTCNVHVVLLVMHCMCIPAFVLI